jgi:magnesium-transporting ATPase (P-type)
LFGNRYVLYALLACAIFQASYVYWATLQAVFESTPLNAGEWLRVLLGGAILFIFAELEKAAIGYWRTRRAAFIAAPGLPPAWHSKSCGRTS